MQTLLHLQYTVYPKEFVEEVRPLIGDHSLVRNLAYNHPGAEHSFAHVLLEGRFENMENLWAVRKLYEQYQRLSHQGACKQGKQYSSLAQTSPEDRTWSDGEHIFVTAVLESNFSKEDLWSLRRAYDAFKQAMRASDPKFVPVGATR